MTHPIMKTNNTILLTILFLFYSGIASAQVLEPPAIEVTQQRTA